MLDGLKRLLIRLSQAQPVILMLENLHWIDAETQDILDTSSTACPPRASAARQLPAGVSPRLGQQDVTTSSFVSIPSRPERYGLLDTILGPPASSSRQDAAHRADRGQPGSSGTRRSASSRERSVAAPPPARPRPPGADGES